MSNLQVDPDFEARMKLTKAEFPNIPDMVLRMALHAAIQHDEKGGKKVRKGKFFGNDEIPEQYRRIVPEKNEVKGIEILPPQDSDATVQDITSVS